MGSFFERGEGEKEREGEREETRRFSVLRAKEVVVVKRS